MKNERQRLPLPPTDIIIVLASTVAVFFILAFGGKALEAYRLQRHNAMLRAEMAALQKQREQLEARLEYVQTPEYVEEVAREQYKWTRAGEKLIIAIFQHRPVTVVAPTPLPQPLVMTANAPPGSHWPEWWKLLAGSFD